VRTLLSGHGFHLSKAQNTCQITNFNLSGSRGALQVQRVNYLTSVNNIVLLAGAVRRALSSCSASSKPSDTKDAQPGRDS
jgi:hypothetical protein